MKIFYYDDISPFLVLDDEKKKLGLNLNSTGSSEGLDDDKIKILKKLFNEGWKILEEKESKGEEINF